MEIDIPDAEENGTPQDSSFFLINDALGHLSIFDPATTGKVDTFEIKKLRNTTDPSLLAYLTERRVSAEFLAAIDIYIDAQVQNDQQALFQALSSKQQHPLDIYVFGSPLEMYKHAIRTCKDVAIYKHGVIPCIFNEKAKSGAKRDFEEDNRNAPPGRHFIRVPDSSNEIPKLQDSLDEELAAYVVSNNITLEEVRSVDDQILLSVDVMRLGTRASRHHKTLIAYAMAANPVDVLKYALFGKQKSEGGNRQAQKATPAVNSTNPSLSRRRDRHGGDQRFRRGQKLLRRQLQKSAAKEAASIAAQPGRPLERAQQENSAESGIGGTPQSLSNPVAHASPMEPAVLPSRGVRHPVPGLSSSARRRVARELRKAKSQRIIEVIAQIESLQGQIHALNRPCMDTATEARVAVLQLNAQKLRHDSEVAVGIIKTKVKGEVQRLRGKKAMGSRDKEVGDLAKSIAVLSEQLEDGERKMEAEMDGLVDGVQRL